TDRREGRYAPKTCKKSLWSKATAVLCLSVLPEQEGSFFGSSRTLVNCSAIPNTFEMAGN
ncbi:MAG: hypothetical protein P8182_19470, partial [Deltaproteobacteria bacterium]